MQTDLLIDGQRARRERLAPSASHPGNQAVIVDVRRSAFDDVTIRLHWATVLLVLAVFATTGLHAVAEVWHRDFAPVLLQAHRSFGASIWFVTMLRIVWRLTNAHVPAWPAQKTKLHRGVVKANEYSLYALMLAQPLTGLLTTLFSGHPFAVFFWHVPSLISRDEMLQGAFHLSHELGAGVLAALVAGHAGAALFHHFVLRDDVLARMAPVIQQRVRSRGTAVLTYQPGATSGE